jgi:hypothetical protein
MMTNDSRREPNGFALPPERQRRKWEAILAAFLAEDWATLRAIQRTGARGRILAVLVRRCFDALGIGYASEPVFDHVPPAPWYTEFAARHGLKLATHGSYNPDFLFEDGCWVEVTLSQNTAFKRLFRYGHQAPRLVVLWLDPDEGLHRQVCEGVRFPNAVVRPVSWYYPQLEKTANGSELIRMLETLRGMKTEIL